MVQFATNGAGGPERLRFITQIRGAKPHVVISLDAPDERHDAIRRRKNLFRNIMDASKMLREAGVPVAWNATVFPSGFFDELPEGNLGAVPELIDLSRRLRIPLNAQPVAGAPRETARALGEILEAATSGSARSPFITNSPRFIRMLLTGDSGPCRYGDINISIDSSGEVMKTIPGNCYFATDCGRCYYTCVWEP